MAVALTSTQGCHWEGLSWHWDLPWVTDRLLGAVRRHSLCLLRGWSSISRGTGCRDPHGGWLVGRGWGVGTVLFKPMMMLLKVVHRHYKQFAITLKEQMLLYPKWEILNHAWLSAQTYCTSLLLSLLSETSLISLNCLSALFCLGTPHFVQQVSLNIIKSYLERK